MIFHPPGNLDKVWPATTSLVWYDLDRPAPALYETILAQLDDAIWLLDITGSRIIAANVAAGRLAGRELADFAACEGRTCIPGLFMTVLPDGSSLPTDEPVLGERTWLPGGPLPPFLQTATVSECPLLLSVSLIHHNETNYLLVLARELQHGSLLLRRIVQHEKLEAVGHLISNIAHQFNNPLQALYNSLQLSLSRANTLVSVSTNISSDNDSYHHYLIRAQREVDQMIHTVQQMLELHRPPNNHTRRLINLHELLQQVINVLQPNIASRGIRLVLELTAQVSWVYGIRSHLKQVCESLLHNAIDSMPDGGILTIRSTMISPYALTLRARVRIPTDGTNAGSRTTRVDNAQMIVLEFSDTGYGIAPEDIERVFEPFYSTQSNRLGLSLAISYGIVQRHHGTLSVNSTPENGTTFRLLLPAAQST